MTCKDCEFKDMSHCCGAYITKGDICAECGKPCHVACLDCEDNPEKVSESGLKQAQMFEEDNRNYLLYRWL
jgi:hypothetical protein